MDQFELISRKSVQDSDGFYTDYCLYYDSVNDRYVTVFGDSDIYTPEDGYFDAEFDTESEATEWFNSYTGFEDDEDYDAKYDARFEINGYYSSNYSGLEADFYTDDWSEMEEVATEMLYRGDYVEIIDRTSGKSLRITPDEYDEAVEFGEWSIQPYEFG